MTLTQTTTELTELLEMVAKAIDIPEEMYHKAVEKYKEVGEWLCAEGSELANFEPAVYAQGSTRLGTNNRPITHADEYDFDGVIRLAFKKENTTQHDLKHRVGDRLKAHHIYRVIIDEGRRCWTLVFDDTFHMDFLPAIPNEKRKPNGILITDKELREWQFSNPVEYANWFKLRMVIDYPELRKSIEFKLNASVEDVPSWKIKTPLQRSVQLLKRHRDIYFQDKPKSKPISIIITTLAARAYRGENNVLNALTQIVPNLRRYVELEDGKYKISNPVEPEENFADKWTEHLERQRNFFDWLGQLEKDFAGLLETEGLHNVEEQLTHMFGKISAQQAVKSFGQKLADQRQQGNLRMATATRTLGATGTAIKPHDFHGEPKPK